MPSYPRDQQESIEQQCLADFEAHKHKILLTSFVIGYKGEDSVEVYCTPPARVRVLETQEDDICHWNDDWCDPYWDVELIEPHPALEDVRSLWIDGPSRRITGESSSPHDWNIDDNQQPAYQPPQPKPQATTATNENTATICCPFCKCELHIDVRASKKE